MYYKHVSNKITNIMEDTGFNGFSICNYYYPPSSPPLYKQVYAYGRHEHGKAYREWIQSFENDIFIFIQKYHFGSLSIWSLCFGN